MSELFSLIQKAELLLHFASGIAKAAKELKKQIEDLSDSDAEELPTEEEDMESEEAGEDGQARPNHKKRKAINLLDD